MKRSNIFLGITTGVLAVVAFTAAKSAKFTHKVHGYITSVNFMCTYPADANPWYTVGASNSTYCRTYYYGERTVYEYKKAPCVFPLFTIPGID